MRLAAAVLLAALAPACVATLPPRPTDDPELIAEQMAGLRALALEGPVAVERDEPDALRSFLQGELDREWRERDSLQERAYKAFGLLPPQLDLRRTLLELYGEQVVGYYDERSGTLHVVERESPGTDAEAPGVDRVAVLAHEAVHALQDRRFGLRGLGERARDHDDRARAAQALIEGDATLAGFEHSLYRGGLPLTFASPLGRKLLRLSLAVTPSRLASSADASTEALRSAPPILQDGVLAPYLEGARFAARVREDLGWAGVDDVYLDPPESTEQVLHPERYVDHRDRPVTLALGGWPAGWRVLFEDTLGELAIRSLLRTHLGPRAAGAASDWDGDRYALLETPAGEVIAWRTIWDSPGAARRFARACDELRVGPLDQAPVVERSGLEVAVVLGAPAAEAGSLARGLLRLPVERPADDWSPPGALQRVATWPLSLRSLQRGRELRALGGLLLELRWHPGGHRASLLRGALARSERTPDRRNLSALFGLAWRSSDVNHGYSAASLPVIWYRHQRGAAESARGVWRLVPLPLLGSLLELRREGDARAFNLLGGRLLSIGLGAVASCDRARVLGVPLAPSCWSGRGRGSVSARIDEPQMRVASAHALRPAGVARELHAFVEPLPISRPLAHASTQRVADSEPERDQREAQR